MHLSVHSHRVSAMTPAIRLKRARVCLWRLVGTPRGPGDKGSVRCTEAAACVCVVHWVGWRQLLGEGEGTGRQGGGGETRRRGHHFQVTFCVSPCKEARCMALSQVDTGFRTQVFDSQQKMCFPERVNSSTAGPGVVSCGSALGRDACLGSSAGTAACGRAIKWRLRWKGRQCWGEIFS